VSDRTYEVLFIADPNLSEPDVDKLTETVQGYAEKEGAKTQKVEKWGKKRLAYDVKKHREGYYVLLVVDARVVDAAVPAEPGAGAARTRASATSSGGARSASSARTRSTTSTTRT
jgi:small subunit ribosomal protein S6